MRLKVTHQTSYAYDRPVQYGLQQVRLTPRSDSTQSVLSWKIDVTGCAKQVGFEDQHGNMVSLISVEAGREAIDITCSGEIETLSTTGVVGPHAGRAPLWYFNRSTPLTAAGERVAALIDGLADEAAPLARLHGLSAAIRDQVSYEMHHTSAQTTAEGALSAGHGVCQDHAHIFLSAARKLGFPARYVSGYLMMNDRVDQDASHAWAEAHVDGMGWVGFDVSNVISPDERYVRIATGLDYDEAAPVSGVMFGGSSESLTVRVQVEQVQQ